MSLFNILQLNMYLLYSAQYLNLHEYNDENTDNNNNNNNNNNKLSEREKKKEFGLQRKQGRTESCRLCFSSINPPLVISPLQISQGHYTCQN